VLLQKQIYGKHADYRFTPSETAVVLPCDIVQNIVKTGQILNISPHFSKKQVIFGQICPFSKDFAFWL